jgi:hypothetical protein
VSKTEKRDTRRKAFLEIESGGQTQVQNEPFRLNAFGKGMLDDNTYNLMEQLEIESKSLWRIKNNYKKAASADNESRKLWSLIEKDKEEIVSRLTEKIRQQL